MYNYEKENIDYLMMNYNILMFVFFFEDLNFLNEYGKVFKEVFGF